MPHRLPYRFAVCAAAVFLLAGCLFAAAYHYDSKYLFGPPYGADGVIEVSDDDLDRPVPLVDGWMLSVDGGPRTETFIGQYSDFSYAPGGTSAFGYAVYELTLSYVGAQRERALVLLVPEVYGDFTLYVNGVVAAAGGDGAQVGIVADRDTRLRLEVRNDEHYYSGLVYPPVLGTAQQMANVSFANALSACVLVLGPLAAALFAFAVRRKRDGDALARDFGVLCAAFAVAGAHGLVWHLGAAGAWWYAVEDAAWTCVLVSAVSVAARAAGSAWTRDARLLVRRTARALWALPVVTLAWALSIPALPGGIEAYGLYQTAVRVGCWALFAVCAAVGLRDRTDEARFVLQRIDAVDPREGEYDELLDDLARVEHAEALAVAANGAHEALAGEQGAIDALGSAVAALDGAARYDAKLGEFADALREAGYVLEDMARETRDYREGVEFDPETLAQQQERMASLQGLLRTYGPRMEDVLARRAEAADLVSLVDDAAERERAAQRELDLAEEARAQAASALADARAEAAPRFAEAVTAQMDRLEMGGAQLVCDLAPLERVQWTKAGPQAVEFLFRPGAGMQARPLARIASGGEVSRVMLAVKVVLGEVDDVDTLVFDEVDAGVGGSTAVALADVLADLARTHQVIVVTHLAQVAVRGQAHYVVRKAAGDEGAMPETDLRQLPESERPAEIARMLSGDATETSLAHAREMLARAAG